MSVNENSIELTRLLHRLAAIVSEKEVAILNDLYGRLDRYCSGVDGERFRIDHKDGRSEIDKLTGRFIRENFEPKKTYRPTLLALAAFPRGICANWTNTGGATRVRQEFLTIRN